MKNQLTLLSFLLIFSPSIAQKQSKEITQKYYPEPKVKFTTPSILIKEERFANYDEIIDWLNNLVSDSEFVNLEYIGKAPSGKKIPILHFFKNNGCAKVKVWMQGALHGNEPAGAEGLLALAHYILNTREGEQFLNNVDITILPIANIDGYLKQQRRSGSGYDLNRDQTKFADPVSIIIKKAFIEFSPDLALDFHEFGPEKKVLSSLGEAGASFYHDVQFLPSGHPNIPDILRETSTNFFQKRVEEVLDVNGYSHSFYVSVDNSDNGFRCLKGAINPRSSATSYALSNAISMLVEIRGIGLGKTSFVRRTHAAFLIAKTYFEQAALNPQRIKNAVNQAKMETLQGANPIYIKGKALEKILSYTFIDLQTGNLFEKEILTEDGLVLIPEIERSRPNFYILEPSCEKEIEILRILGVEVDTLKVDAFFDVVSYQVISCEERDRLWENIYPAEVKCELIQETRKFLKGSFLISLHQENANYAVSVLEPESDNGFVTFRVTETNLGELLKIHRLF